MIANNEIFLVVLFSTILTINKVNCRAIPRPPPPGQPYMPPPPPGQPGGQFQPPPPPGGQFPPPPGQHPQPPQFPPPPQRGGQFPPQPQPPPGVQVIPEPGGRLPPPPPQFEQPGVQHPPPMMHPPQERHQNEGQEQEQHSAMEALFEEPGVDGLEPLKPEEQEKVDEAVKTLAEEMAEAIVEFVEEDEALAEEMELEKTPSHASKAYSVSLYFAPLQALLALYLLI